MVHDNENRDEFSNGTLWIEPETGQVLKTEMNVAGREGLMSFRAQTGEVSYKNNAKMAMLVPVSMVEHYIVNGRRVLNCQADYSDFHRFEVETHFDFGPQIPDPPAPPVRRPPS